MHIIYPKQENAVVAYEELRFHKRNETYSTQKDRCTTIDFLQKTLPLTHSLYDLKQASISRPVIGPCRRKGDHMIATVMTPDVSARKYLPLHPVSVIQSLVPVAALRCHYFVAQSPMTLSSPCRTGTLTVYHGSEYLLSSWRTILHACSLYR